MTVIVATIGLGFAKVTFFLMYYKIFWPKSSLRYPIYIGGIATALFYTANTICLIVFIFPRPGDTHYKQQQGSASGNVDRFSVASSAVGAAIDLYILVLPIGAVTQLQLATKRKIGIVVIFMSGFLYVSAFTTQVTY